MDLYRFWKRWPDPLMAAVEGPGVAGEQGAHAAGEGPGPGPDQEVGVIREERPGVDGPGARLRQGSEPGDEVGAIGVIPEDDCPLDPAHHDMVQGARRIQARLARHGRQPITS